MKTLFSLTLCLLFNCIVMQAQIKDSVPERKTPFSYHRLFVPASLLMAGIASNANQEEALKKELAEERNAYLGKFHTPVDNYLQFAPIAIAYGLDAAGIRSKTDLANRTAILFKSELIMIGTVSILKYSTKQLRPDGSDALSFPSGHTAQAFAAATFLSEEYKHRFPWMPYAAYGISSSVALLRMANNKHYISDVLAGAAIGILSTKIAYWTHRYHWTKKNQRPAQLF